MVQRTLFLGCSSIAVRRALPALLALDPAAKVDIASRGKKQTPLKHPVSVVYDDYAEALRRSPAELVYVSLHNSAHFEWALKSLESGRHVIVDKPAFLTLAETERALDLAAKVGRCLAEATAFEYHAQFTKIEHFLTKYGPLNCVSAQFNIPPLAVGNFRNHAALGGGCLADMGPYAAAVVRRFGSGSLVRLAAMPGKRNPETGVDIGFSMLAGFAGGLRISGDFGFEGEYVNRLSLLAKGATLTINRIFSPPPDHEPEWEINIGNTASSENSPADDAFRSFLAQVDAAIGVGSSATFAHHLFRDAQFREALRIATESSENGG